MNLFSKDMIKDMGPMEGNQEIEDDEYSRVLDNEKAAHQFLSYILKKPALCAYCKGVLIGKVCYDVVWYNAPSDWLLSVSRDPSHDRARDFQRPIPNGL